MGVVYGICLQMKQLRYVLTVARLIVVADSVILRWPRGRLNSSTELKNGVVIGLHISFSVWFVGG